MDYTLKRHDTKAFVLRFVAKTYDDAGNEIRTPIDFTGYTITGLLVRPKSGGTFDTWPATAADPTDGRITVSPTADNVDTEGSYLSEVKTTAPGGTVETFPGNGPGMVNGKRVKVKKYITLRIDEDLDDLA